MLLLFLLVSAISFAGSIHPGTVNLAVAQVTLSHNWRAGLWLALGGSLPEIAYSVLAAGGVALLPTSAGWQTALSYAPIPVLLGAGLASFRQKPVVFDSRPALSQGAAPFWKGLLLGGTNPQLLPFWSAVWLYLSGQMLVGQKGSQWVFALATSFGAFVLLAGVVWLANRQRTAIARYLNGRWLNRLTGLLFINMALYQLARVLTN